MAFNIRKCLGIDGTPGSINHDHVAYPIPESLMDAIDSSINQLVDIIALARANKPAATIAGIKDSLDKFVASTGLESFFPPGHPLVAQIATLAAALAKDPKAILNSPEQLQVRSQGALYNVVLYCDDSGSMSGSRVQVQADFASRVCDIITPLDPNGVSLRFINDDTLYDDLKTSAEVANIICRVPYTGGTPIGKMMEKKILGDMVFKKIQDNTFNKPLLVIIITDGAPSEGNEFFRDVIRKGKKDLKGLRKPSRSVKYQINQICPYSGADEFVHSLVDDKAIQDVVYITSDKLEDQIAKLKKNNEGLNDWLYNILKTTIQKK